MARTTLNPSKKFETKIKELSKILGHTDIYGEIPKTLEFGVTFTLKTLKAMEQVIPYSADDEMPKIVTSIETIRNLRKKAAKIKELQQSS